MRNLLSIHILYAVMLIVIPTVMFTACDGGDKEADPKDAVYAQLRSHEWKLSSVTVSGVDETEMFEGLKVKLEGTSYSANPSNPIWRTSGIWTLETDSKLKLVPAGSEPRIFTILTINDNALKLSLTWDDTTLGGGRAESIEGSYVFEFQK